MQIIKEGNPNISCKCPECGCEFTFTKSEAGKGTLLSLVTGTMDEYYFLTCPQKGCGAKLRKLIV